jgi:PHD/YefM family antitoxin component YafN of YafNO toxin-antitoxin module
MITRHGQPTVVVLSMEKFQQMAPRETLADILQECPVKGWGVDRSEDTARDFLLQ